jgi:hypothetical protein
MAGAVAIRGLQGPRAPATVPVIGPFLCDYTVFDYFLPALHRGGCAAAGVAIQAFWPDQPFFPLDDAADLRGVAPSLSRFTRMIDAQHHQTLAIEAILKHVSRAENLQYDGDILPGQQSADRAADVLIIPAPCR